MKTPMTLVPALAFSALLAGCATDGKDTSPAASASGVSTVEKAAVSAQGDAAATVTITRASAIVESIDLTTRLVGLVAADGTSLVVQAGEQVRNLDQVKVGDRVTLEYFEGFAAELRPAGTPRNEVQLTEALTRAKPGERPAGAVGDAITANVVIEFVDTVRNVVRFKGPLGKTRVIRVMKPEFRAMLQNLKVGDTVAITYFEAVAVSVAPIGQ